MRNKEAIICTLKIQYEMSYKFIWELIACPHCDLLAYAYPLISELFLQQLSLRQHDSPAFVLLIQISWDVISCENLAFQNVPLLMSLVLPQRAAHIASRIWRKRAFAWIEIKTDEILKLALACFTKKRGLVGALRWPCPFLQLCTRCQ